MTDEERINNCKNSVGDGSIGFAREGSRSLPTKPGYVYRTTQISQIEDIVNSGYVRPKENAKRGQIVYWGKGGKNIFCGNEIFVLESTEDKVYDGKTGAIHITDLTGIYMYNPDDDRILNCLDYYLNLYYEFNQEQKKER